MTSRAASPPDHDEEPVLSRVQSIDGKIMYLTLNRNGQADVLDLSAFGMASTGASKTAKRWSEWEVKELIKGIWKVGNPFLTAPFDLLSVASLGVVFFFCLCVFAFSLSFGTTRSTNVLNPFSFFFCSFMIVAWVWTMEQYPKGHDIKI
jgi:hypothetical protein